LREYLEEEEGRAKSDSITLASALAILSFGTPFARALRRATARDRFKVGSADPPPAAKECAHKMKSYTITPFDIHTSSGGFDILHCITASAIREDEMLRSKPART
jgi:hypothetical protein